MKLQRTRNAVYHINYHFVWTPKYRRSVLIGKVRDRLEEIIVEIAQKMDYTIHALEIMPDHVHLFVTAPPRYAPSEVLKRFKGTTGRKLLYEFPKLRELVKRDSLWTNSCFVGTAGAVSAETIQHYIETQS